MDIQDFKKIRTQQDLVDYLKQLDVAVHSILMNDGVNSNSALYCALRFCEYSIFFAKCAFGDFDVKLNSFIEE